MPTTETSVSRLGYGHVFRFDDQDHLGSSGASGRSAAMISNLKNKLALLERQREAMRSELKHVTEARDGHLDTLSAVRADNDQLRQQLDALVQEIDQKQHMIGSLKQSVTDAEANVALVKQTAKESRKKAEELRNNTRTYEQAMARIGEQNTLAQTQTQALRASLDRMEAQHAYTTQLYEALKTTIDTATRHILDRQTVLTDIAKACQLAQARKAQLVEEATTHLTEITPPMTADELAVQIAQHLEREATLTAAVEQCQENMNHLLHRIRHF